MVTFLVLMIKPSCPCCSQQAYDSCCQPIIEHDSAQSAEQLMRSRYTAFAMQNWDYIAKTWHPDTAPKSIKPSHAEWLHLRIVKASEQQVLFEAVFDSGMKIMRLREQSRFALVDEHWRYLDGDSQCHALGRNEPCYCGRQKKFKKCCWTKQRKEHLC